MARKKLQAERVRREANLEAPAGRTSADRPHPLRTPCRPQQHGNNVPPTSIFHSSRAIIEDPTTTPINNDALQGIFRVRPSLPQRTLQSHLLTFPFQTCASPPVSDLHNEKCCTNSETDKYIKTEHLRPPSLRPTPLPRPPPL